MQVNGTVEMIPLDDRELCKEAGLSEAQVHEVIIVGARHGIEADQVLLMLAQAFVSIELAAGQVAESFEAGPKQPDFASVLAEYRPSRTERRQDEQRLRSMRKPTGRPWDRRGR
jgi:hypothetical protein